MIAEYAHFALLSAFAIVIAQSVLGLIGAQKNISAFMQFATTASYVAFLNVLFAFACLTYLYMVSDFSVENVWANSHTLKPMLYKITGVWGNHEGSMLLWVLILTLFTVMVAHFSDNLPSSLKAAVLGVQGLIASAFLAFIIFTSNPFNRIVPTPLEGNDLNPLLQDIGLAIHPPLLYLGYVGFSVSFSFAIAALLQGRLDAAWARWVRPWTLAAWLFLTLGISMGSYWAYYELGWGGWWFWDPVENASFMPWLLGTALLHSALVMEKREALKVWTVLLAILTFSLSLLGTFLVRSGVLTSVHAFATDPERGVFILVILLMFIGGGLTLFAVRASSLKRGGIFAPLSREGALVFNNLFLTASCATVLIGTLYPLFLEMVTGQKISVGPPYFNLTFLPLVLPLFLVMPFGPLLSWKRAHVMSAVQRLYGVMLLSCALALILWWGVYGGPVMAVFGLAIGFWLFIGSFSELALRAGFGNKPLSEAFSRLKTLPRSQWGTAIAHAGMGITVLGAVAVSTLAQEAVANLGQGDQMSVAGYTLTLEGVRLEDGPNYQAQVGVIAVEQNGSRIATLTPEKRFYPARAMPTTEASIRTKGFNQLYVSLGEMAGTEQIVVRAWYKPMVTLIWIGSLFMAFGGVISLADRRLRVGAPKKANSKLKPEVAKL
jgi:cytochrome c-type biogenesis protein CcmF